MQTIPKLWNIHNAHLRSVNINSNIPIMTDSFHKRITVSGISFCAFIVYMSSPFKSRPNESCTDQENISVKSNWNWAWRKALKTPDKYSVISKMITHEIIIMHYCAFPIYKNSNDTVVYLDFYHPQTHVVLVSMPMLYIKAQIYHDRFYLHNRCKTMAWICK